ncbi:MAG: DUF3667 domain-containing protein [Luteibacter sp.]
MNELKPSPVLLCANCTAPLQGAFCHDCGQSIKSVIQPVSHMLEDAGDLFFHLDERIVHTLPPLYLKPGFLTLEYFAGRRVRYIAPFRLMFVFCLLAFFVMHIAMRMEKPHGTDASAPRDSVEAFATAKTPDEVRELYKDQTRELRDMATDPTAPAVVRMSLGASTGLVREAANTRLAELKAPPIEEAPTGPKAHASDDDDVGSSLERWTASDRKVHIGWLPDAFNDRLSAAVGHLRANLIAMRSPSTKQAAVERLQESFFSVLPQTMLVMIPVFALVLKLFYLFRRRLYMEHILVALHSHAFLFISLMGITLLTLASAAVRPHAAFVAGGIGLVQAAMWIWMPVYLLLMQKRVYRQGWGMTILKFWLIGSVYFWLMIFAVTVAGVISMTH